VLTKFNEALQKHAEVWKPYVDDIEMIKKNFIIDHYYNMLYRGDFSDIVIITPE
jgi:hypothetical protein